MLVGTEKHSGCSGCGRPDCHCQECLYGPFTRNHYFTGKLLVERDFRDEQCYYVDKHLLHQQRLHGEGVVCGLLVHPHDSPACRDQFVIIDPGLALDCCGHDILVTRKEIVDFTQLAGYKKLAATLAANPNDVKGHDVQLCIRYRECPTEEIPVLYDECGCDGTACAPNRILESYEFDLILDPDLTATTHCVPTITFRGKLPIAGVGPVVAADVIYILAPNLKTLTKLNALGTSILETLALPGDGKALARSEDGKTLYVAALDAGGTNTQLWAIDTTVALALPGTGPGSLGAGAASVVELATPPSAAGQLVSLRRDTGALTFWNMAATPPASTASAALAAASKSLVAGAKGLQAFAIDPGANKIKVVSNTGAIQPDLGGSTQPAFLALASTTAPDILFVIDQSGPAALSIRTDIPKTLGTLPLAATPLSITISNDKRFAFLVFPESGKARIRPLDLDRLAAGKPEDPGEGLLVEVLAPGIAPALLGDGSAMLYPESGPAGPQVDILGIAPHVCPDLYALENCPSCDDPDCIVLATFRRFRPGFYIEDPLSPPFDPNTDFTKGISRIDNRLGRHVLPSTQKIAEMLDCLLECNRGGIPGPPGPAGQPGGQGDKGEPGLGLSVDFPKIMDTGWQHGNHIKWDDFQNLYNNNNPDAVARKIKDNPKRPSLVIYFNEAMLGVDRQTFRVSLSYPQLFRQKLFSGLFNVFNVDLYGTLIDLGAGPLTPHTAEPYKSAWAFIPRFELFTDPFGLIAQAWDGFLRGGGHDRLDLPCLRITLSGDFVYSPDALGTYEEKRLLDGNNIGGRVGLNSPRVSPYPFPAFPKNPSGDLVEGGTFESWLFFDPPSERPQGNPNEQRRNFEELFSGVTRLVRVNHVPLGELQTLPGITPRLAKKIVALRERQAFMSLEDFRMRLDLSEAVMNQLANSIVVD
jgi:hypothetical protein